MADELLKLKWNGHLTSFLHIFQSLRLKARYTDVTLACEGQLFTVHRLVLASCSQFFDHIFEQTPAENTVIILNEAKAHDIEALLDYMYCGQVDVHQSNLASFIRTAKCLQIKGLATPDNISADEIEKTKRPAETSCESPVKRKKGSPQPPHPPSVLFPISKSSLNRHLDESPPKASSPSHHRWIFQRSDLPNTTWSSSQGGQPEGEGRENQAFRANAAFGDEEWVADEPTSNSSPHPHRDIRKMHHHHLRHENETENNSHFKSPNHFYKETLEGGAFEMKTEVKQERKDEAESEAENLCNPDYSSPNYSYMNTFDNEDPPEHFSNPSFRRNHFESTPVMEGHNAFAHSRMGHPLPLVKEVPPTTSQATVSPKLMPFAKCSNCLTNNTKLWRRSMKGEIVCNACGLYYKLHGVNRPSHLFRNAPMTRRRNPRKKKKLYEEIVEGRDQNSIEDKNDSFYNESGCDDSDTQDGLAVLNAALTLNSLFAKAKAQEAAAAAAAAAATNRGEFYSPQAMVNLSVRGAGAEADHSGSSKRQVESDSSSLPPDSRPPPPLLKLQPPSSTSSHHYPSFSHSPKDGNELQMVGENAPPGEEDTSVQL